MDFTRIKLEKKNRTAVLTLSRPEKRNALDDVMVRELSEAFQVCNRETNVKVVLLRAEGDAFCAGADLAYLKRLSEYDFSQNQQDSQYLMKLFLGMYTLRKPIIALVQGPALAGGCGLVTVCDFVLAAKETASFGYPEVRIGFIPAIVLPFLVRRVGEARARELTLRGHTITADEAESIGLITRSVPATSLMQAGETLARELQEQNSGSSMGLVKELFSRVHGMSTADALDYAANLNALTRMTDDCKKGIARFLNKEKQEW
jgi:methylglutaconyl-CoA hydratase